MRVLIIGSGGREHALAWSMAKSHRVTQVFVAPGNGGTDTEPKCRNIPIEVTDVDALVHFAEENGIDLTVVGPEAALMAGVVDAFEAAHLACFGPTKAAAILEGSKAFTKDFLKKYHIPTADYEVFTNTTEAKSYAQKHGVPLVIKADGLAAGKGVILAFDLPTAYQAIDDMLENQCFGKAGNQIVIESFLQGEELSFIAMVDGKTIVPLASAQDHKARDNGDQGPNTGGMGAYSPAPLLDQALLDTIMTEVMTPTVAGMAKEGRPFKGFLYAGLMIAPDRSIKVLEFNCRFGDPETQPILMRLQSDFAILVQAACYDQLGDLTLEWDPRSAVGVVLAAKGYPEAYDKGQAITLPVQADDAQKIFHAGTVRTLDNTVISSGGRILCACALGETLSTAQQAAYDLMQRIHCEDTFYRTDIGHKGIARITQK